GYPPNPILVARSVLLTVTAQQDHHLVFTLANQPLKRVIRDMGGGTCPPHDPSPLLEEQTACAPNHPAVLREAFTTDLVWAPALADGVAQLDAVGVDAAEHRWGGQEELRPVVMRREETQKPGPIGEVGKQRPIVARQPARERPVAHAFVGVQQ